MKPIIAVLHLIIFHVSAEWDNKTAVKYVVVNMASAEARPWNTQYRPCSLQMMWSYWTHQSPSTHTGKVSWDWGSASVNLRLWSSAWKGRSTHSGLGEELLPQVETFKYLGVFFTAEGKMEQEIVDATAVCCSKERAEPEAKDNNLLISLCSNIVTGNMGSWIQAVETSFLHRVAEVSLRANIMQTSWLDSQIQSEIWYPADVEQTPQRVNHSSILY